MTCQPPRLHQQHTKRLAESILTTFRKFQEFIQMLISYINQARQFSPTDARAVHIRIFVISRQRLEYWEHMTTRSFYSCMK